MPERLSSNPNFLRLYAAQATSLIGSGVTSVALAALAYDLAGTSATIVVGTALTLRILAFITLSPVAGVLADRVDRKRMLIGADLIRVALLGLFPFITTVGQVYALIFAINAVTAFFTPTFEAVIPEVVGPRLYTRALSWARIAVALEASAGPLLAGLLIATVGVRWTFWADGATYLISALLVLPSRVPNAPAPSEAFPWGSLFSQLAHGTRVLFREPALRKALLLHLAEAVAGALAIVTTVVYVREVLTRGDVAFSVLMAAVGAGSAVVALWLPSRERAARQGSETAEEEHIRFHRWAERTLVCGGAVLALSLLPGVLMPGFVLMLLLWTVSGAGQALVAIPSVVLLAEHSALEERGRTYAAHFAWTHLFWLGTYPASGYLAEALGTPLTFTLGGVLCALLTLAALAIRRPRRTHPIGD